MSLVGMNKYAVVVLACLALCVPGAAAIAAPEKSGAAKQSKPASAKPEDEKENAAAGETETIQSGPKVTTQQHGDWLLECYDPAISGVNCQIKQRIIRNGTEQNVLVLSIAYDPEEKSNVIQYVLPLDFLLTPGVSVEVGDYQSVAGVNRCAAQGCFIEGTTDDAFIKAMKASNQGGRVVLVSRTGQKVGIGFSASGFTKAYQAMVQENVRLSKAKPDAKVGKAPAAKKSAKAR